LILIDDENLIPLLNVIPTSNNQGWRFNCEWRYNNFTHGLMGKVVERLTGRRFVDFVRERILKPLGMSRTAMQWADVAYEVNVASPCASLSDGSFAPLGSGSWPCEGHTPLLAAAECGVVSMTCSLGAK
jgi:CubicO group peptidase (beta-lactamase class C family)